MTPTEQIKSKLDIVDFISGYIQLKPAGSSWKARCPFHNEKTPSFMVSRDRQSWHCFGCNEGGDIFTFVQKIEGMDFSATLKFLAEKAGVRLEVRADTSTTKRARLLEVNRIAAEVFHKILSDAPVAAQARKYLQDRGLTNETIRNFKIGYATDSSWDSLVNYLRAKHFSDEEIIAAGLGIRGQRGVYDRFRGRIVFPITNVQGAVIGFTGRVLQETSESGGKYINSPQTDLYNKSGILFGLDKAKQEIRKQNKVVVVEGNMDVIASHQAGIVPVVAASGTALTSEQLELLRRFTTNILLCFDEDAAGQAAADKGISLALSKGYAIKVVTLPKKINGVSIKDPDDCIRADVQVWQDAIDNAQDIMDYYFSLYSRRYPMTTAESKRDFSRAMLSQIARLEDAVERDTWLMRVAQKVGVSEHVLRESFVPSSPTVVASKQAIHSMHEKRTTAETELLALLIATPRLFGVVVDAITPEMLVDNEFRSIYKLLVLYYSTHTSFSYTEFEQFISAESSNLVSALSVVAFRADHAYAGVTDQEAEKELFSIIARLKRSYILNRIQEVQRRLDDAEREKNAQQIASLSHEFNELIAELNALHK